jgi:hypothetical protein
MRAEEQGMIGAMDQFTAQATLWGIEGKPMPKAALSLISGEHEGAPRERLCPLVS